MRAILCDICNNQIKGDYIQAMPESTNKIMIPTNCEDVCMECWKAFKNTRRISLVEFPNSEAKDHE